MNKLQHPQTTNAEYLHFKPLRSIWMISEVTESQKSFLFEGYVTLEPALDTLKNDQNNHNYN